MICGKCGKVLKGELSIERGYGPICYKKVFPKKEKEKKSEHYSFADDPDYNIPGQMELKDFIEM